ncbi:OmpW family protein [Wenzhouxiangella sp. XN79A]|uniref:OmpW/AlkL family protein n=1 Tax=Wenzhouxiangella sp. XN79A TaxID=2724193 RepID=UPI00144A5992|nr:OmpW family outer membrane protein [Wenzhouxiangella sp. XN79A]NKI35398.1 OmpW family protein [Wenzhouxiangella sp. XN79A]
MKTLTPRTLLAAAVIASSVTAPAMAQEAGDWLFRIGATYVAPNSDSGNLVFEGTALDGFQAEVDDKLGLGFNITYFLSPNWGVELLLATPFEHDIDGDRALTALGKLGSTKHLPPVLGIQYHFAPNQTIRPYVGAGINYTLFFDEDTTQSLQDGIVGTANGALGTSYSGGATKLSIDDSFGLAFQAGVDIDLNEKWFLNFDARYIDIKADASLRTRTFDTDGSEVIFNSTLDVDIDPWVLTTAVGFRF